MKRAIKGATLLTANHVASYGCSFLRNLILARILAKSDFGLAAAFATTVSLLELAGRLSFGNQLVQSKQPRLDELQSTLHAFLLVFGIASAVLFVVLALPISTAFKVPHLAWAFALLGIVPLLKGLEHLDNSRQRRDLNFIPSILTEFLPQLLATAAAWPVARLFPDFRAIIILMVGKSLCTTVLTHILAVRTYRIHVDRSLVRSISRFSGPLLLNGFVMFASQQADQMLIGFFLTLENLATYSVVFSLVSIPWFIVAQVSSSLMLPVLARHQDDPVKFLANYTTCLQASVFASLATICPLIVAGDYLIRTLYGPRYHDTGVIVALLGATCAIRFLRLAPAIAALSRADTLNQLYSNIVRSVSLPCAGAAALLGGGLPAIATAGVFGEAIAAGYSFYRLHTIHRMPVAENATSALILVGGLAAASTLAFLVDARDFRYVGTAVLLVWIIGLIVTQLLMPQIHELICTTTKAAIAKAFPQRKAL